MTRYNKTIEIVTFDELDEKAKEKAREWARDGMEYTNCDLVTEDFKEQLSGLGYPTEKIEWSLGFVQSDFVAFYGRCDQDKLLERLGLLSDPRFTGYDAPTIEIKRYGCDSMYVEVSDVENEDLLEEIQQTVKEDVRNTANALMHNGHETILDLRSDESVDDFIMANEYTFRLNGTREDL